MTFYQENTIYHEDGHGAVDVTIIISNAFENIFKSYNDVTGTKCNIQCVSIDKVKKTTSDSSGNYIYDQLNFTINQAAFGAIDSTEPIFADNQNCLFFCTQAEDTTIKRYIAVHIGAPSLSSQLFVGSINSEQSGEDKKHYGGLYTPDKYPIRDYQFTAKNFDAFLLKACDFRGNVYNTLGIRIDNIRERLGVNAWSELKGLFGIRFSFISSAIHYYSLSRKNHAVYFNVGNLGRVLQLILDKASDMIYAIDGTIVTFNVAESDLGIQTAPSIYKLIEEADPAIVSPFVERETDFDFNADILSVSQDTDRLTKLKIYPGNPLDPATTLYHGTDPSLWSAAYIEPSIVDEEMFIHEIDGIDRVGEDDFMFIDHTDSATKAHFRDWSYARINKGSNAVKWTWTNCTNVMELLQEIAQSFGVYLSILQTSADTFQIKFIPRESHSQEEIFFRGAKSGGINLSSKLAENETRYYSQTNDWMLDGADSCQLNGKAKYDSYHYFWSLESQKDVPVVPSEHVEKLLSENKRLEDLYSVKSKRLLFTLNSNILKKRTKNFVGKVAGDLIETHGLIAHEPISCVGIYYDNENPYDPDSSSWVHPVMFNNGVFIVSEIDPLKEPKISEYITESGGNTTVIRPANKVYTNIDNADYQFDTLGDYVNYLFGRDVQFFESEYDLSIPFINGFSLSEDGSNPSFQNLKLGSKISINEKIRAHIAEWEVLISEKDYLVEDIEIEVWKLTTTLKLHKTSKYRFTSTEAVFNAIETVMPLQPVLYSNNDMIKNAIASGIGAKGDAIKLRSDGLAIKAIPHSSQQGRLAGIALNDFNDGERVLYQTSGRYSFSDDFMNTNFERAVVRMPLFTHPSNVFDVPLMGKSATEDQILIVGRKVSANQIDIELQEYQIR